MTNKPFMSPLSYLIASDFIDELCFVKRLDYLLQFVRKSSVNQLTVPHRPLLEQAICGFSITVS